MWVSIFHRKLCSVIIYQWHNHRQTRLVKGLAGPHHVWWCLGSKYYLDTVLKIRTVCHARELWKLAWSWKQLYLLCLRVPTGSGKPKKKWIFWKSHRKSWNFENHQKSCKSHGTSHTDKSSPSIRNLALISFASHLVSCIHSNTSDYELLEEFEANPLVYCYWFLI